MLLCIVYGILFVDTLNMKLKAHNSLNAMFVKTVNTGVCEVWKLYSTLYKVASCSPPKGEGYCTVPSILGV